MLRSLWYILAGLFAGFCGWSVPVYWQLVNTQLLEAVGADSASVQDHAEQLIQLDRLGAAALLLRASEQLEQERNAILDYQLEEALRDFPEYRVSGGPDPYFDQVQQLDPGLRSAQDGALIPVFLPLNTRKNLGAFLEQSRSSSVRAILATREMSGLRRFMPVYSAAGQPLEATILLTALLMQGNHFSPDLAAELRSYADRHEEVSSAAELERIYFALFSLGKRLNWDQVTRLLPLLKTPKMLEAYAAYARNEDEAFAQIYAAALMTQDAEGVIAYLDHYPDSSMDSLGTALKSGTDAVLYLLAEDQELQESAVRRWFAGWLSFPFAHEGWLAWCARHAALMIALKAVLLLAAALLITRAFHLAFGQWIPFASTVVKGPRWVALARGVTLSLIVLSVFIVFTEPGVFRQSQTPQEEIRLELTFQQTVESLFTPTQRNDIMDQITILTIVIFFLLQVALYMVCLLKMAEIRKLDEKPGTKLELLQNEDNLFDAGLYVGLGGTVLSLIFLAVGIVQASLMAAYSSTLFGILFVAMIKIFHLRPLRRQLIIDIKSES